MGSAAWRSSIAWLTAVGLLLGAPSALASEEPQSQHTSREQVLEEVGDKLAERRRALLEDAHEALDETRAALAALDAGETDEALEALARATGKLELVVTRQPDLALAPVALDVLSYDVHASPDTIRRAREQVQELLEEGRVQEARALLSGLASEVVFRTTNLPLATYPDAIKEISPLIDAGEIEEAKRGLRVALNTLVVTDRVVSLPVLRARALLDQAEELLAKAEEPDEQEQAAVEAKQVSDRVAEAREQLKLAELLGYGDEQQHARFRKEIDELQARLAGDRETSSVFASLRSALERFQTSFFQ